MIKDIVLHWFRQDLRTLDNPALCMAASQGVVLPIYIFDNTNTGEYQMGSASRWWLHHSLHALNNTLDDKLSVYIGDPKDIIIDIVQHLDVKTIYWNRCYEPWQTARDKQIRQKLKNYGTRVHSFNGSLLWEPWDILKKDGTPYKVFTSFYRNGCLNSVTPRKPLSKPKNLRLQSDPTNSKTIDNLNLLPSIRWDTKMEQHWKIGEQGAKKNLQQFLRSGLEGYKQGRNFPNKKHVSRLSPHLHFGEISPNQVWHAANSKHASKDTEHFLSELGWREFSYNLLYHFPKLPSKNFQPKFNHFPWKTNKRLLQRWQTGQTGFPFIDAGMRELWQTGYMHNRVRMVVGSFLVKNLLLHWHHGEKWFWDCLVDADLANNSASWQWVAGSGADAAPYFRIFNPVLQSKKFDPEALYIRKWVPELKKLKSNLIHAPWEANKSELKDLGIVLGKTYPKPIIDLKASRTSALDAYNKIR